MNNEILDAEGKFPSQVSAAYYAPPKLNPQDYCDDLAELQLTDEQASELLNALWHIMSIFVDIGWGVDTVQIVLPDLFENIARDSNPLLESKTARDFTQDEKGDAP